MTVGRVRVLVFAVAADGPDGVSAAYHAISRRLAGTPGLLGNELLRSTMDPQRFLVMSEWESLGAFRSFQDGQQHRADTAPLRPFQDRDRGTPFGIYEVAAAY